MSRTREFRLTIDTGNEAFQPEPNAEIARILREVADRIESDGRSIHWYQNIRDVNGNTVGQYAEKNADYWN